MENFFTILGGMGTLATESFIHTLNKRTEAHRDQDYLNYIVVTMRRFLTGQSILKILH